MRNLILSILICTTGISYAQSTEADTTTETSTEPRLNISGTVDVYSTLNIDKDKAGIIGLLSDQNTNNFGIGMANVIFSYEGTSSGLVADLSFGPRANAANTYSLGTDQGAINQLYAYYAINDMMTITLGHFNTYLGYEVITPAANFNYTVSYLFNAGPFSHTGAKLDISLSEDLSIMLAITNPHAAQAGKNEYGNLQYGAQIGFKGQFLNLIYGSDVDEAGSGSEALYLDYTGGYDITDMFYLGINAAYHTNGVSKTGYQGIALYPQIKLAEQTVLGLRPELYSTSIDGDTQDSYTALTTTLDQRLDENFSIKIETRYDNIAPKAGDSSDEISLLIAAIYAF